MTRRSGQPLKSCSLFAYHITEMKSRILLCFAVVLSGLFIVTDRGKCAEAPSGLTVMIDIPEIWKDGKVVIPRSLGNRYPARDHFFVVIQNTSPEPIVIRDEDDVNRALHFEVTTPEGKTIVLYRTGRNYSKYVENEIRLAPGEVTVREIYYGRDWDAFPFPHDPKESAGRGGLLRIRMMWCWRTMRCDWHSPTMKPVACRGSELPGMLPWRIGRLRRSASAPGSLLGRDFPISLVPCR
jgi:hypothetical protein